MDKYILYNGKFVAANKALLDTANRGLNYGDGFFESLKWQEGKVLFFAKHLERITNAFDILQFSSKALLKSDKLEKEIGRLINKNNSGSYARIRILFFRNTGGFYSPKKNTYSYVIQTAKQKRSKYPTNTKGKKMALFSDVYKVSAAISNIKSLNSLVYVLAGLHAKNSKMDDCFILNDKGNVVDAISSSVVLVKNSKLQFSPVSDGGVDSIMKHVVKSIAIQNKIKSKSKSITLADVEKADEILICNVSKGIEWVANFGKYQYESTMAKQLQKELNSIIS